MSDLRFVNQNLRCEPALLNKTYLKWRTAPDVRTIYDDYTFIMKVSAGGRTRFPPCCVTHRAVPVAEAGREGMRQDANRTGTGRTLHPPAFRSDDGVSRSPARVPGGSVSTMDPVRTRDTRQRGALSIRASSCFSGWGSGDGGGGVGMLENGAWQLEIKS